MQGDPKASTETSPKDAGSEAPVGVEDLKEAATQAATQAATSVRGMLDQPIAKGTTYVEGLARSARGLAKDLDSDAPQIADMVRRAADTAETISHDIRDKSVEELFEATEDFARRQPALFVGAAVAAGFLLARFVKTGMSASSSSSSSSSRSRASLSAAAQSASTPPVQQSARTFHDA